MSFPYPHPSRCPSAHSKDWVLLALSRCHPKQLRVGWRPLPPLPPELGHLNLTAANRWAAEFPLCEGIPEPALSSGSIPARSLPQAVTSCTCLSSRSAPALGFVSLTELPRLAAWLCSVWAHASVLWVVAPGLPTAKLGCNLEGAQQACGRLQAGHKERQGRGARMQGAPHWGCSTGKGKPWARCGSSSLTRQEGSRVLGGSGCSRQSKSLPCCSLEKPWCCFAASSGSSKATERTRQRNLCLPLVCGQEPLEGLVMAGRAGARTWKVPGLGPVINRSVLALCSPERIPAVSFTGKQIKPECEHVGGPWTMELIQSGISNPVVLCGTF